MNMDLILNFLPIDKNITDISISYLKAVALGFTFITIFTCLRCYSEGMTLTIPVFCIAARRYAYKHSPGSDVCIWLDGST